MSTAVALDTSPEAEASVVEMIKKHLSDPETQAQIKEQLQEEFARVLSETPNEVFSAVSPDSYFSPAMLLAYTLWITLAVFAVRTRASYRGQLALLAAIAALYLLHDEANAVLAAVTAPLDARQHFDSPGLFALVFFTFPAIVVGFLVTLHMTGRFLVAALCQSLRGGKGKGEGSGVAKKKD